MQAVIPKAQLNPIHLHQDPEVKNTRDQKTPATEVKRSSLTQS